jgi:hypothetical protein
MVLIPQRRVTAAADGVYTQVAVVADLADDVSRFIQSARDDAPRSRARLAGALDEISHRVA